jgi:hypothetical protein
MRTDFDTVTPQMRETFAQNQQRSQRKSVPPPNQINANTLKLMEGVVSPDVLVELREANTQSQLGALNSPTADEIEAAAKAGLVWDDAHKSWRKVVSPQTRALLKGIGLADDD